MAFFQVMPMEEICDLVTKKREIDYFQSSSQVLFTIKVIVRLKISILSSSLMSKPVTFFLLWNTKAPWIIIKLVYMTLFQVLNSLDMEFVILTENLSAMSFNYLLWISELIQISLICKWINQTAILINRFIVNNWLKIMIRSLMNTVCFKNMKYSTWLIWTTFSILSLFLKFESFGCCLLQIHGKYQPFVFHQEKKVIPILIDVKVSILVLTISLKEDTDLAICV